MMQDDEHLMESFDFAAPEEENVVQVPLYATSQSGALVYALLSIISFGVLPLLSLSSGNRSSTSSYHAAPLAYLYTRIARKKVGTAKHPNHGRALVVDDDVENVGSSSEACALCRRRVDFALLGPPWEEVRVQRTMLTKATGEKSDLHAHFYIHRNFRHVYDPRHGVFRQRTLSLSSTQVSSLGLSGVVAMNRLALYGDNNINIPIAPLGSLLWGKLTHPFYIFQLLSVVIWLLESYTTYALLILGTSALSIGYECWQTRTNEQRLRSLADVRETSTGDDPSKSFDAVPVIRDGVLRTLPSTNLVVGDVVVLSSSNEPVGARPAELPIFMDALTKSADLVVLSGEVVVDESSLTGETIPVVKRQIPSEANKIPPDSLEFKASTIFAGSRVISIRSDKSTTKAMVSATGFASAKGQLIHTVLFPKEVDWKFSRDSRKFIMMLGSVAIAAVIIRVIEGVKRGTPVLITLISSMDLVTVAVPPALPIILTVGVGLSVSRLKNRRVFTVDPQRINFAGRIDTACWDKTGTLTGSSMLFTGVDCWSNGDFRGASPLDASDTVSLNAQHPVSMRVVMAACNSLSPAQGDIVRGHPLDVEMFRVSAAETVQGILSIDCDGATHPSIIRIQLNAEATADWRQWDIIKRFEFASHLQRESVVAVATPSLAHSQVKRAFLLTKGSPKSVYSICDPSKRPSETDYMSCLRRHALGGYYVLAIAAKEIPPSVLENAPTANRSDMETQLSFLGLVLFRNNLKPTSVKTLATLQQGGVRNVMITGDDVWTATWVGMEVDMIKRGTPLVIVDLHEGKPTWHELQNHDNDVIHRDIASLQSYLTRVKPAVAVRGDAIAALVELGQLEHTGSITFSSEYTESPALGTSRLLDVLLDKVTIWASVKPDQKTFIVERLISRGRVVSMCGDGTNDCGALKAAHVGLALSNAEASMVAPFTSGQLDIANMVDLVNEGRCALETSFASFRYMIFYPLIQLTMAATLARMDSYLSNNQYLFDDTTIVSALGFLMLYTLPSSGMVAERPTDNLFAPRVIASLLGQLTIWILAFATVLKMMFDDATDRGGWFCSIQKASVNLDPSTFFPLNSSAPPNATFPCYVINPTTDVNQGALLVCHENVVVWVFGHLQLATAAVVVTLSARYRRPFWTNLPFTLYALLISVFLITMLLARDKSAWGAFLSRLFGLRDGVPEYFRWKLFWIWIVDTGLSVLWEWFIVDGFFGGKGWQELWNGSRKLVHTKRTRTRATEPSENDESVVRQSFTPKTSLRNIFATARSPTALDDVEIALLPRSTRDGADGF
ncbi:HAD-like protein [Gonapodya prolifera JEL478]|uniref:HAD-like protein n=1 Tax=Gonapodya prolifera (strain JEL478) TaxID=1344416 RepID=A0A139AWQ9_GONPJ|nr:HAD-like protein [Gonapodya prolifera JEL478]|eukprot:KXS21137.1 HAD-like protein [Gonapodya prolifera JEL478]